MLRRPQVVKGFQESLPCAPALTALDATAAGITDASAAGFRRAIECSAGLRHLRLDRNRLNQAAMQVGGRGRREIVKRENAGRGVGSTRETRGTLWGGEMGPLERDNAGGHAGPRADPRWPAPFPAVLSNIATGNKLKTATLPLFFPGARSRADHAAPAHLAVPRPVLRRAAGHGGGRARAGGQPAAAAGQPAGQLPGRGHWKVRGEVLRADRCGQAARCKSPALVWCDCQDVRARLHRLRCVTGCSPCFQPAGPLPPPFNATAFPCHWMTRRALAAAVAKHPNLVSLSIGGAMRYKLGGCSALIANGQACTVVGDAVSEQSTLDATWAPSVLSCYSANRLRMPEPSRPPSRRAAEIPP